MAATCVTFKRKKKGGRKVGGKRVCFAKKSLSPKTRAARKAALARRGRIYGADNLRDFACKSGKTKAYPALRKACRALGA